MSTFPWDYLARLTLSATFFFAVQTVQANTWIYSDLANNGNQIILSTVQAESAIGHRRMNATFCEPKDKMACFEIASMHFAVPKSFDASAEKQKWRHNKVEYVAFKRPASLGLVGKQLEVFVIESNQQEDKWRFYFSPHAGLVAIMADKKEAVPVFLLRQACGFAAATSCK